MVKKKKTIINKNTQIITFFGVFFLAKNTKIFVYKKTLFFKQPVDYIIVDRSLKFVLLRINRSMNMRFI